jgi:hypothetical protein
MPRPQSLDVLNRVLTTLYRSLPMYLEYAVPWTHHGDERAVATVLHIIEDQKALCRRIGDYILEHHGRIDSGDYPLAFTSLNDVALDYLIGRLIESQRQDIQVLENCVAQLEHDARSRSLAEEALGAARGHLESLEELRGLAINSPAFR